MIQLSSQIQAFLACFCADVSCHAGLHLGRASCHVEGISRGDCGNAGWINTWRSPNTEKVNLQILVKTLKQVHFLRGFHAKQLLAFQSAMTVFEPIRCIFSVPTIWTFFLSYMKILLQLPVISVVVVKLANVFSPFQSMRVMTRSIYGKTWHLIKLFTGLWDPPSMVWNKRLNWIYNPYL